MSTIETNKLTRQNTTIDNDYMAPAGYDHEGGRHKTPAKNERAGNLIVMTACALGIICRHFLDVIILTDELWDIFCIYPRDNSSYSSFEQQHSVPVLTIS